MNKRVSTRRSSPFSQDQDCVIERAYQLHGLGKRLIQSCYSLHFFYLSRFTTEIVGRGGDGFVCLLSAVCAV